MGGPTREPSLDELLDDPIAQLLMECDGVEERDVRKILDDVRQHHARTEPVDGHP
jgi:hypothetical protein